MEMEKNENSVSEFSFIFHYLGNNMCYRISYPKEIKTFNSIIITVVLTWGKRITIQFIKL